MNRTIIGIVLLLLVPHFSWGADPAKELEVRLQKVIEDVSPSVVAVVVAQAKYPAKFEEKGPGKLGKYESVPPQPGGSQRPSADRLDLRDPTNAGDHTFGAGIVLDAKKGHILVPYHLVEGATKVFVRAVNGKGSYANIRAADTRSDLAVLELIDAIEGMKPAKLAAVHLVDVPNGPKINLKEGSLVVSVGHALAAGASDGRPTGSLGVLGNIRRRSAPAVVTPALRDESRNRPLHTYGNLLQTDARLGASGSALVNFDGEVIGIASTVAAVSGSEASGGFALPLDPNYRRIIEVLQTGREVEYGFLGVLPHINGNDSVQVAAVTAGCPAASAGLQMGDVILSVDGNALRSIEDLHLYVGGALAASKATLSIQRDQRKLTVQVILAKNHNPMPFIATVQAPAVFGLQVDYASVRYAQAVNGQGNRNPIYPVPGVAVRDLDVGSVAEKKFADIGDISKWLITHVDGKAVPDPTVFLAAVKGKAQIKLTLADIYNPNKSLTIQLP